jgi:hypothetical protein
MKIYFLFYHLFWHHDNQHNDTQHNDTQYSKKKNATLSIMKLSSMIFSYYA